MCDLLIVDDDEDTTAALADCLVSEGHQIRVARDGLEGLSHLHSGPVDLILLDVEMPRLTGPEMAYQLFCERTAPTPASKPSPSTLNGSAWSACCLRGAGVRARLEEDRLLNGLVAAFAVVALAFVAGTLSSHAMAHEVQAGGRDLLTNALPSVAELMRARTAQRDLDVDVALLGRSGSAEKDGLLDRIAASRGELESILRRAMATPDYPGEREIYEHSVKPLLARLDRSISELRTLVDQLPPSDPRIVSALTSFDLVAKDLDLAIQQLAEVNHAGAFAAARRVVASHTRAIRLSFALDAFSAILALVAAAVCVHAGRRYATEARRRLEFETGRAAELDLVAQRVAHDLMSPLAAVSLALGRVRHAHGDPETARVVERGLHALERSRQMVQGIYAFSQSGAKPAPGASAPLRTTIVQASDDILATEPEPAPTVDFEGLEDVEVAMDRAVLGIVATNLLSNALKFSRDSTVRRVTVRSHSDDARVRVEFEDTGPGVPAGLEESIFEPYRRAPGVTQPGLGLGLATVQRLILAHGGKIGVRKARGGGAIFWFDLPRAAAERPEGAHPEAPPARAIHAAGGPVTQ
jgi:signal transduction histidine kinase